MRCDELMKTEVERVSPEDTVQQAARIMREKGIGFLPVCDAGGKPLGAVTDRDLAIRGCAEDLVPSRSVVGDVMTREVVACRSSEPLSAAEQLMSGLHKSRVMCLDEAGKLTGIISLSDIAAKDSEVRAARTLKGVVEREVHAPG